MTLEPFAAPRTSCSDHDIALRVFVLPAPGDPIKYGRSIGGMG